MQSIRMSLEDIFLKVTQDGKTQDEDDRALLVDGKKQDENEKEVNSDAGDL